MHYYDKKAELHRTVNEWLVDENRDTWADLVRRSALKYGFNESACLKALEVVGKGSVTIENGELVRSE